jgi:hypothetical protein
MSGFWGKRSERRGVVEATPPPHPTPNEDGLRAADSPPVARTHAWSLSSISEAEQIDHEIRCEGLVMLSLSPMRAKCEAHVRCSSIYL